MNNMDIYNAVRSVPPEAQKKITGGRMNGKTDINPMWRIKCLTEQFGACGIGWKYEITRQWLEHGSGDEVAAFCNINLYVKVDGVWSEAIPGTGGNSFVTREKSGAYTSDECFKMALTDAISVACKALGVAADVYWNSDHTKYDKSDRAKPEQTKTPEITCPNCGEPVKAQKKQDGTIVPPEAVMKGCGGMCYSCYKAAKEQQK